MPLVVKSGTAIDEALQLRGMRPKDIDKILLVGGTSKIPLVRRYVSEKLGGKEPEPFDKVDPMTCVAQGAAIVAAILQEAPGVGNRAYSVKLEHSLCANPINERRQMYLDPIIKRGADIPCSFTKTYHPVADPAERVVISVFEGDVYDEPDNAENVKLAEIPWEFNPPRTQRDGALDVTFEYGDDGILTVQIHDPHNGQKKRFAIQQSGPRPARRRPDHEDEADQRGSGQTQRGPGIVAGIPRRPGSDQEDRAGRHSQGRGRDRPPGAGGFVPADPRGDVAGRQAEDGAAEHGAERSAAEFRVFAISVSPVREP